MKESRKKKIIIIGGGISGLTAGIYALDNDFDVTIYEKHYIPGGQCTGWTRKNIEIDGCAHWIVGTNPKSDLFPLWKHIGAFNENTSYFQTEYFSKFDFDGKLITLWKDIYKLYAELVRLAPEDKKRIRQFIRWIKAYQHVRIPVNKPLDKMNLWEITKFGLDFLPMLYPYLRAKHLSCKDYAKKFKNKNLQFIFENTLSENYNLHSLLYVLQALTMSDTAVIKGGSLQVVRNIQDKYLSLGGKLYCNKEVKSIIIENNVAKGVVFKDDTKEYADYIIGACYVHHILYDLLDDKYTDSYFKKRFDNNTVYPLSTGILVSFKVTKDISSYPKMIAFKIKPFEIGGMPVQFLSVRNHSYTKENSSDPTTLTVLIGTNELVYTYFKSFKTKKEYLEAKNEVGKKVEKYVQEYFSLNEKECELIDITTPLTYERYTNAYHGSYQSYITTARSHGLMRSGILGGLKNFVLSGQWLMPPGGLPIALFTGKHAVYRLCGFEHKKFINKEKED
jgi:phytoene dehydrogenase-like protein